MKIFFKVLAVAVILAASAALRPGKSAACTTACSKDLPKVGPIVVKSYDWDNTDGYVMVNHVDVAKTAIGVKDPAIWKSKYQTVTFNQWGMNMPLGGMNEKGLVVEIMKVGDFTVERDAASDYPIASKQGDRRAINQVQWVQYILDQAKDLHSAIGLAHKVYAAPHFRVAGQEFGHMFNIDPVHYLVCQENARCRVFEYRGHKLLISRERSWHITTPTKTYRTGTIPYGRDSVSPAHATVPVPLVPVLANNYAETDGKCLDAHLSLKADEDCAGTPACHEACGKLSDLRNSARRYVFAASKSQGAPAVKKASQAASYGFHTMAAAVCNPDTRWQIVYLPKLRHAYWKATVWDKKSKTCQAIGAKHGYINLHTEKKKAHSCRELKLVRVWDLDGGLTGKPYERIEYPSLRYPTLTKINGQSLVNNFVALNKSKRVSSSDAAILGKGNGLSFVEMTSAVCN